jgi:hypothetical protein
MIRITNLRTLRWSLATACATALACGQHLIIGANAISEGLSTVDPIAVGGVAGGIMVPQCAVGSEHPNVCCIASSANDITCGTYPDEPFRPCPDASTTYPDPRACCALSNAGSCTQAPQADGGPILGCPYTCPPGYVATPQSSPFSGGCCLAGSTNPPRCFGWSSNAVREEPDGASSTMVQTTCACPPTFEAVVGEPDVCCGILFGSPACFSIGIGAAAALLGDAGTSTPSP